MRDPPARLLTQSLGGASNLISNRGEEHYWVTGSVPLRPTLTEPSTISMERPTPHKKGRNGVMNSDNAGPGFEPATFHVPGVFAHHVLFKGCQGLRGSQNLGRGMLLAWGVRSRDRTIKKPPSLRLDA